MEKKYDFKKGNSINKKVEHLKEMQDINVTQKWDEWKLNTKHNLKGIDNLCNSS